MQYWFTKDFEGHKAGDAVKWCSRSRKARVLVADGVLTSTPPKPPKDTQKKEG